MKIPCKLIKRCVFSSVCVCHVEYFDISCIFLPPLLAILAVTRLNPYTLPIKWHHSMFGPRNNFLSISQTRESNLSCHPKWLSLTRTGTFGGRFINANLSTYYQMSFILPRNNWGLTRNVPVTFVSHSNYVRAALRLFSSDPFLLLWVVSIHIATGEARNGSTRWLYSGVEIYD